MRKIFVRTLAVTAVIQFAVTRTMAGHAIEEGRAERMWMMYPLNVLINAIAWTLLLSLAGSFLRVFRHAP
jgi:hypothetical protein